MPFETDGIVFKEDGKVRFKIIGVYNTGLLESLFGVEDYILDNNEEQIKDIYESNYQELRRWVGNMDSNEQDLKNQTV